MAKDKRPASAAFVKPSGPSPAPSEIAAGMGGKRNTTERLRHNINNPIHWGKTRSCPARNAQETTARDVDGTENGTNN